MFAISCFSSQEKVFKRVSRLERGHVQVVAIVRQQVRVDQGNGLGDAGGRLRDMLCEVKDLRADGGICRYC